MRMFSRIRMQHKLFIPNVLSIFLLGAIIYFFINANGMIKIISHNQEKSDKAISEIQATDTGIQSYINHEISYSTLSQRYSGVMKNVKNQETNEMINKAWKNIEQINNIRTENGNIEKSVNSLSDNSILQSNTYIKSIVEKLADEKIRSSVTTLEMLVIGGANNNTTYYYQLKVLFANMKEGNNQSKPLLDLITSVLENVNVDIKHLAGTPFQSMAEKSRDNLLKIRDLTNSYIKNANTEHVLQKAIASEIYESSTVIENVKHQNSEELFSRLKSYFRSMLIIILGVSILGILVSIFTLRSVSKALRKIIHGLSGASREVDSAAGQLSEASESLAGGATEQAASIEEISASLEEISAMTKGNAKHAGEADSLMQEAQQTFETANSSHDSIDCFDGRNL